MSKKIYVPITLLFCVSLACGDGQRAAGPAAPPTRTPLPTFTVTSIPVSSPTPTPAPVLIDTPIPIPATVTPMATFTAIPTGIPTATPMPTETPLPPTNTPPPTPTEAPPTETPTPEPIIKYVIADAQRELNCEFTYIYGTVKNANNFGIPDVEVRALGIHQTTGLEFTTRTDAEGRYEIFRIPFADLLSGQWAIMLMEDGREMSERFHWGSTPACGGDDSGNSQALRLDWKLIE